MLRRLSSQFKKDKDKHKDGNGNGNGNGNGKRMSAAPSGTNGSSSKPPPVSYQPKDQDTGSSSPAADTHVASREDVEKNFKAFGQLIHASLRPMPTQTGDGTYLDETPHHASLFENLSHLGIKDVKTLLDVLHGTATGELVDDKTMLMERVIQVRGAHSAAAKFALKDATAGVCSTPELKAAIRLDQCFCWSTLGCA
jgi:linoleate 10R-lipoxygenase